jgi:hypothetical protein
VRENLGKAVVRKFTHGDSVNDPQRLKRELRRGILRVFMPFRSSGGDLLGLVAIWRIPSLYVEISGLSFVP